MKRALFLTLLLRIPGFFTLSCASTAQRQGETKQPPSLSELCLVHKTDKCATHHNYVEIYDTFFAPRRHRAERLLEIGVLHGNSVRMWEAYFSRAMIFGLDIRDVSEHETARIKTAIVDQAEREQLARFLETNGSSFDIVIDDGGHGMEQQQVSFGFLFPHVRPKGIYIIEDIHTSFRHLHKGYGVKKGGVNSTYTMIQNFIRDGFFSSEYMTEAELAYLNAEVAHCLYSYRPNKHHSDLFLCIKK